MKGEIGAGELLPVRLDELPRPGVLARNRDQAAGPKLDELWQPWGGAVDELGITPHDLVKLGRVHAHRQPHHPGIHVQRLQLAVMATASSKRVVPPSTSGFAARTLARITEKSVFPSG